MIVRVLVAMIAVGALLYALYLIADRYLRNDTRRRLEEEHARGDAGNINREDYVQKGLAEYERGVEKKLVIGLFSIPVIAIVLLAMMTN